tara:strand:+ start:1192 stop:1362 length:171 start_codon:yes stop_codon:yes gene_type:complete
MGKVVYHITGVDVYNKRFKIVTSNPYYADGISLYHGTVWKVVNGKRKMIKRVSKHF